MEIKKTIRRIDEKLPGPAMIPAAEKLLDDVEVWRRDTMKPVGDGPIELRKTEIGWTDRFVGSPLYAGIRRTAKVGSHVVGWTLLNAGVLLAAGKDPVTALLAGAAGAAGESMISLGVSKKRKAAAADEGRRSTEIIDIIFFVISKIFAYFKNRKKED